MVYAILKISCYTSNLMGKKGSRQIFIHTVSFQEHLQEIRPCFNGGQVWILSVVMEHGYRSVFGISDNVDSLQNIRHHVYEEKNSSSIGVLQIVHFLPNAVEPPLHLRDSICNQ